MNNAKVSVIIPTWNQRQLLKSCLNSLVSQTKPCSVTVIDNGSEDDTVSMLREEFPQVSCIPLDRNHGFAMAVNIGIKNTTSPYVALLNNDTIADPGWIEAHQQLPAWNGFPLRSRVSSTRTPASALPGEFGHRTGVRTGIPFQTDQDPVHRGAKDLRIGSPESPSPSNFHLGAPIPFHRSQRLAGTCEVPEGLVHARPLAQ